MFLERLPTIKNLSFYKNRSLAFRKIWHMKETTFIIEILISNLITDHENLQNIKSLSFISPSKILQNSCKIDCWEMIVWPLSAWDNVMRISWYHWAKQSWVVTSWRMTTWTWTHVTIASVIITLSRGQLQDNHWAC